ncbi:hypothetical protein G7Z17_g13740 [Cylindrodendrum hubeiense]|uniref:Uncharacterized protein n=1 Tax=Cylindrodendrum hubeiense TaxID=595255 RepID=A0A9P5GT08_9HYPO|nr:hypothetical protein G7Z17_g13740 [Cylindrodendrum hubeiense]
MAAEEEQRRNRGTPSHVHPTSRIVAAYHAHESVLTLTQEYTSHSTPHTSPPRLTSTPHLHASLVTPQTADVVPGHLTGPNAVGTEVGHAAKVHAAKVTETALSSGPTAGDQKPSPCPP